MNFSEVKIWKTFPLKPLKHFIKKGLFLLFFQCLGLRKISFDNSVVGGISLSSCHDVHVDNVYDNDYPDSEDVGISAKG